LQGRLVARLGNIQIRSHIFMETGDKLLNGNFPRTQAGLLAGGWTVGAGIALRQSGCSIILIVEPNMAENFFGLYSVGAGSGAGGIMTEHTF
jgi:hypothetical protein